MSVTETFELPAGAIAVTVACASSPLADLCDFAARNNPRRGFLIVSRVLGRHLPTSPAAMGSAMTALAAQLGDLPGPVVVIGMAETAVALGQGVHEAMGRDDSLYLPSTRQQVTGEVMLRFAEPHSHAAAHLLFRPQDADLAARLAAARSLVLVDDECSTGTTLANLGRALAVHLPQLQAVRVAVLTDWSADHDWLAAMPAPAAIVSLLRGQLDWTPRPFYAPPSPPPAAAADALGTLKTHRNFGRLGVAREGWSVEPLADRLAARFAGVAGLRVLGTGEFTWPPFQLARALAARGIDVTVQATTRSPIHPGGAIASALTFHDNYGTPVPNYLYNCRPDPDRPVLICHETPAVDPALLAALGAEAIDMVAAT
jgi:hypothetical protein